MEGPVQEVLRCGHMARPRAQPAMPAVLADALVSFLKEVAAAAPNVPFYYYHIPALTGVRSE